LVNNVETLANLASIILKGPEWFSSMGIETSRGTKVFALTGDVKNTGLVEVPFGITLRELIYGVGGGMDGGETFKAVQLGGPSGGCLTEDHLDLAIDYESLKKAGVDAKFIRVKNAGHGLRPTPPGAQISPSREQLAKLQADWFRKYLGPELQDFGL